MKKVIALLLMLFVTDVYAQVLDVSGQTGVIGTAVPTETIPTLIPSGTGTNGTNQPYALEITNIPLSNINATGTNGIPLYLGDDNIYSVTLPFNFSFFGNTYNNAFVSSNGFLSFTNHGNGCCNGYSLPNLGWNNSIFGAWSDLISYSGSPYIRSSNTEFDVGWYTTEYGTQNPLNFEISLFSNNNFLINYGSLPPVTGGHSFTAGIMGDSTDEVYQIFNTSSIFSFANTTYRFYTPPAPTYWDYAVSENQTFTLDTTTTVRYGANDTYVSKTLNAGTYSCSNNFWGDPIGGVYKHCDIGSYEAPAPTVVDCNVTPGDTSCIIKDLITPTVPDTTTTEQVLADTTTTNNDTTSSEEVVASSTDNSSSTTTENSSFATQEVVSNDVVTTNDNPLVSNDVASPSSSSSVATASAPTIDSLASSSSTPSLSDNIDKNILAIVLAVVDSTSNTQQSTANNASAATQTSTSSKSTSSTEESSTSTTETIAQETSNDTQIGDLSSEILATGIAMNNATQQEIQNSIEGSLSTASEQATQKDNSESSSTTLNDTVVASNEQTETTFQLTTSEDTSSEVVVASNEQIEITTESTTSEDTSSEVVVAYTDTSNNSADSNQSDNTADDLLITVDQSETTLMSDYVSPTIDQPEPTSDDSTMYASVEQNDTSATNDPAVDDIINNIVNNNEKTFKDEDVEMLTTILDNAGLSQTVANAIQPTFLDTLITTDQVNSGSSVKKEEDKSDAEKKAEQIVAANKEEQEAISNNYMDADQSGLIGAIAGDVDVSSYRAAMLPDNNIWYKPEDIYKNVTYKDNSRSLYFLEKGNTDTYKKMVNDQYK